MRHHSSGTTRPSGPSCRRSCAASSGWMSPSIASPRRLPSRLQAVRPFPRLDQPARGFLLDPDGSATKHWTGDAERGHLCRLPLLLRHLGAGATPCWRTWTAGRLAHSWDPRPRRFRRRASRPRRFRPVPSRASRSCARRNSANAFQSAGWVTCSSASGTSRTRVTAADIAVAG